MKTKYLISCTFIFQFIHNSNAPFSSKHCREFQILYGTYLDAKHVFQSIRELNQRINEYDKICLLRGHNISTVSLFLRTWQINYGPFMSYRCVFSR